MHPFEPIAFQYCNLQKYCVGSTRSSLFLFAAFIQQLAVLFEGCRRVDYALQ
jgi:hypothetical protein